MTDLVDFLRARLDVEKRSSADGSAAGVGVSVTRVSRIRVENQ